MPIPVNLPQVQYQLMALGGGLDQVTPTLSLPPGVARDALNFEASITGGYTRIAGYERFDGQASPSGADFSSLTVNITGSIVAGDTITGGTSGAAAVVIAVSGSTVVYTRDTGTFQVAESLLVMGSPEGTLTAFGPATAITAAESATYTGLAADEYRQDILEVPGEGPIRGVAFYNSTVYAWRNNVGNTELTIHKSSGSGWVAVPLGVELGFDTGTIEFTEGDVVIGATSGATGTITRVVLESGDVTTMDAAGRLIFASVTGTFQNNENLQVLGITRALATGAQAAITLQPSGRVETAIGNFGGGVASTRVYGADGVNRAFEFDGTVYVPINTGMPVDAPTHLAFHKQHLFLSFGSSVQFSALSNPYQWSVVLGAGEIALVDAVTCFIVQPGDQSTGALAVYSDSNTFILYGSSSSDFNLVSYNVGTGAKAYSAQNVNVTYVFSDRGVVNLQTTLNYGNFDSSDLTLNIRPFIQQRRNLLTASCVNREKGQYRIFFSDGTGLYMTFVNGQLAGAMPVLFPDAVTCMSEGEEADGAETSFFGSTDGFVYRLDVGTSFDGDAIPANLDLVFNAIGSPRILKRFRRASLEITGSAYAEFGFNYELGYGSIEIEQSTERTYENALQSSFWDSAVWDAFVWDGRTLAPSEVEVEGSGENIAIYINVTTPYYEPFTINSIILHYTMRRGLR